MTSGKLIVITAPSGAGKTTIAKHLLEEFLVLGFSVSATTRKQREGEVDGRDYYFISEKEFLEKISNGEFLEWEEVYSGCFYGTLKVEMERLWSQGKAILFDVDVKGALHLKNLYPDTALTIFIKPPSLESLVDRLRRRATETHEKVEERIKKATSELLFELNFDVTILNDDLQKTFDEVHSVVENFLDRV